MDDHVFYGTHYIKQFMALLSLSFSLEMINIPRKSLWHFKNNFICLMCFARKRKTLSHRKELTKKSSNNFGPKRQQVSPVR